MIEREIPMRNRYTLIAGVLIVLVGLFAVGGLVSANGGDANSQKQALFQQLDATATANAKGPHAPKNQSQAAAQPHPCPRQLQAGVYPFHIAPNDILHTYHVVNAATAIKAPGEAYMILAGSLISNPKQGVMVVEQIVIDPCTTPTHYPDVPYLMPSQQGAITMTQVNGDTVNFTTETGGSGNFAYATGQFLP
jgi:hypothetical protein